jgi:hypothetical protein
MSKGSAEELQRFDVGVEPIEDHGKAKPAFGNRVDHEDVGFHGICFDGEAVRQ